MRRLSHYSLLCNSFSPSSYFIVTGMGSSIGERIKLPSGYGFHPTDVELVELYLLPKLKGENLPSNYIAEFDVYLYDPQQLPHDAFDHSTKNQAFFFARKNSVEQVRTTPNGYWKAYEEKIPVRRSDETVGFKTKLMFHDSDGNPTDWKMIEYECSPTIATSPNLKNFVACKLKRKLEDLEIVRNSIAGV